MHNLQYCMMCDVMRGLWCVVWVCGENMLWCILWHTVTRCVVSDEPQHLSLSPPTSHLTRHPTLQPKPHTTPHTQHLNSQPI